MSTRRTFLRGAGGATLSIPFLSSLSASRSAAAAPSDATRRLIAIKSYSGQHITDWYPTLQGNGYTRRDSGGTADGTTILDQSIDGTPYHRAPLSDFAADGISTILDTAFNPYLDRMNLLRGLDFLPDTNHNDGGMLGNYAGSGSEFGSTLPHVPTIDQVLAFSERFYPGSPILRSLHLAPGEPNTCSYTHGGIVGGTVQQVQGHVDPLTAFNALFNAPGVTPPDDGGDITIDPNAKLVDRVYEDYVRRRDSSRLSTADRELLERHISFLSELQDNLMGGGGVPCTFPDQPGSYPEQFSLDTMDVGQAYSLMVDVIVAGIICDHSRVVTLDVRKALSDGRGDAWAGYYHGADGPSTWHGDAHAWGDPSADFNLQRLNHWIAHDIFLKLIERLDVVESGDTTYLDNSLVFWGNELGFNHLNYSVPAVTAGGAGGCIQTGSYLDFIEWDSPLYFSQNGGHVIRGIPHNRFLVSVLQAMGLSPNDYEQGGQPGYGSTETVGKSANTHAVDYDFSRIGDPLPDYLV